MNGAGSLQKNKRNKIAYQYFFKSKFNTINNQEKENYNFLEIPSHLSKGHQHEEVPLRPHRKRNAYSLLGNSKDVNMCDHCGKQCRSG